MLYMVGKILLCTIHFNIVYNESGHKNIQSSGKNIDLFKTDIWRGMKQHFVMQGSFYNYVLILKFSFSVLEIKS